MNLWNFFLISLTMTGMLTLAGCPSLPKAEPPQRLKDLTAEDEKKIGHLLDAVDALYKVHTLETVQDGRDYLQLVITINPQSSEAYWRLARSYQWLYNREEKVKEKEKYAERGIKAAQKGIHANPQSGPSHYYYAICVGLYSQLNPSTSSEGVEKIFAAGKKAARLDPDFDYAGPHRLLGRTYLEAPFTMGGDISLALVHLEKSVKIAPQFAENLLALAQAYSEDGQSKKSKVFCRKILSQKNFKDQREKLKKIRQKAKKLLKELE